MLMSTSELAARCKVTDVTVRAWILKRMVDVSIVGGRYVIDASDDEVTELAAAAARFKAGRGTGSAAKPQQVMRLQRMREGGRAWRDIAKAVGLSVRTCRRIYERNRGER